MLKPRTRLISLRITEDEYETIRQASAEGGARCVSEYARKALLGPSHPAATPQSHECGVTACFDIRLTRVEKELAQVADVVQSHLNDGAAQTGRQPQHTEQQAI